jgi:hypothetical protein
MAMAMALRNQTGGGPLKSFPILFPSLEQRYKLIGN